MVWQQSSLHFATLTLTLTLELLSFTPPPTLAQSQVTPSTQNSWGVGETSVYEPPTDIGAPTRTESGSTREPKKCPKDKKFPNQALTALIPKDPKYIYLALTVEGRPTFFVYVPQTSARMGEFILKDDSDKDVYRTNLTLPIGPGIVSFKLPANAPELEDKKSYHWFFVIRCNPEERNRDLDVDGWILRTQLQSSIENELQNTTPRDRVKLYRQYKIWHEALATLADLRRSNPNDSQLATEWKELLESAGQGEFAQAPILNQ
ncbi:DUF928 domain-containing protein [Argonema galeatum]|uniref:DUF928 domain-containing protein n=1 Tax=Argonema galeatum TaxID=2942762 RepID=UPI0020128DF0|nr:DUF928 domain-containing protein [Argonema galeatum]MCL1468281.1 DUF928 domain-containing protein [Argonema galeatum A003/A1]